MLAELNVALLTVWLIVELVPLLANGLAALERRDSANKEDD
jgi:hypothetical protein